jgi:hypothetical protein
MTAYKPGAGVPPGPVGGGEGDVQAAGRLLQGQATEEAFELAGDSQVRRLFRGSTRVFSQPTFDLESADVLNSVPCTDSGHHSRCRRPYRDHQSSGSRHLPTDPTGLAVLSGRRRKRARSPKSSVSSATNGSLYPPRCVLHDRHTQEAGEFSDEMPGVLISESEMPEMAQPKIRAVFEAEPDVEPILPRLAVYRKDTHRSPIKLDRHRRRRTDFSTRNYRRPLGK